MTASLWMVTRWRVTTERPNDQRGVVWRRERLAMKAAGVGGRGGASRVCDRFAFAGDRSHGRTWLRFARVGGARAWLASDATHSVRRDNPA